MTDLNRGAQIDPRAERARRIVAAGAMSVFVLSVAWWGSALVSDGAPLHLGAPPFYGMWRDGGLGAQWVGLWLPALLMAVAIAVVVPLWWVRALERLRWGWVLVGSWCWAVLWSTVLAATDGRDRLTEPLLDHRYEYLPWARDLDSPRDFVSGFVENLSSMPTHVRGHPPGAVIAFWGLDKLFPTDRSITVAILVLSATAAPAALIAVRAISDEASARRAAAFVGLGPAAIWIATSADALFCFTLAWSVALAALCLAASRRRAFVLAGAAGILAGATISMSYGALALLGPAVGLCAVLARRRRFRDLGAIAGGALVVPALLAVAGYDWIEGVSALREQYVAGVGGMRPMWFFVFSNVAAFAVAVGPAAVAGMATLRDRRLWWLVGGALSGLALAEVSGMSKGEVERIWLPAVPWVVIATSSIRSRRERSVWAALTMALAIVLQWQLRSPW